MRILLTGLGIVLTSICVVGQTNIADFSGTWVYKSGMNPHKVEKLTIKQSGAQIDVTEKCSKGDDLLLTYYSDARGESNPRLDGTTQIKSRTKWTGYTLFMLFENLLKLPQSNEAQRSDEWSLSKNGDSLTITITFASETPFSPIPGSTRVLTPNQKPKVHHFTRKQVLTKLK